MHGVIPLLLDKFFLHVTLNSSHPGQYHIQASLQIWRDGGFYFKIYKNTKNALIHVLSLNSHS